MGNVAVVSSGIKAVLAEQDYLVESPPGYKYINVFYVLS